MSFGILTLLFGGRMLPPAAGSSAEETGKVALGNVLIGSDFTEVAQDDRTPLDFRGRAARIWSLDQAAGFGQPVAPDR